MTGGARAHERSGETPRAASDCSHGTPFRAAAGRGFLRVSPLGLLVALTGIEPGGWRFRPFQLGLSGCVFSTRGILRCSGIPPRTAGVTAQSQRGRGRGGSPSSPGTESVQLILTGCPAVERDLGPMARIRHWPTGGRATSIHKRKTTGSSPGNAGRAIPRIGVLRLRSRHRDGWRSQILRAPRRQN